MIDGAEREHVRHLTYNGFGFACRILECAAPVTEPIVVLCGAYQDMYSYRRFDKYWRDSATIICVDLPGSHSVDPLPPSYGYEVHRGALARLVDVLELPAVNLLGISNGFPAAHRFAQRHPSRVARLAMSGAAVWSAPVRDTLREMTRFLRAGQVNDFARTATELFLCHDEERTVRNREVVRRALHSRLSSISPADAHRYLGTSQRCAEHPAVLPGGLRGVRALCMTGEHDTLSPPQGARALAAEMEGAVYTTIRETDHLAFLERAPDWADTVLRFFTDRPLDGLEHLTPLEYPGGEPFLAGIG